MDLFKAPDLPPQLAAKYAGEASRFWDLFYRRNETRFFKDRHYFAAEFPQLLTAGSVFEVGCGVGNSLFPLLELNPGATLYACDFAPSAVDLVRGHPLYRQHGGRGGRVTAFVADITADDLTASVPPASVEVATLIFVLSAVAPEAMPRALHAVAATLRPGGLLLFRDYALGDLAQDRLAGEGRQQRLADGCYVRWDGTLAFYFSEAGLRGLLERAGFRVDSLRGVGKVLENRKTGERMDRRFIQAVCTYVGAGDAGDGTTPNAAPQQQAAQQQEQRYGQQSDQHTQSMPEPPLAECRQRQELQQGEAAAGAEGDELQEFQVQLGAASLQLLCRRSSSAAAAADRAAAEALASAVQSCPQLFANANVLELCCWDAPLGALAALRHCRLAVAAAAGPADLRLLRRNAWRSAPHILFERLRLTQLAWRHERGTRQSNEGCSERLADASTQQAEQLRQALLEEQLQLVQRVVPAGFDAVLAAVPSAAGSADLRQLLGTAAVLLSRRPGAAVLVACEAGNASEAAVAEAAAAARLHVGPPASPDAEGPSVRLLCLHRLP